jgi:hypothetical protein
MPVSARKLAANRANAKKSTGPSSEIGKEIVAQNALKHGLCANFQVLSCENQKEYDDIFERFMQAEKPANDVERELVAKMARHSWLSERAIRCQEACFLVQPQTPEDQKDRANGIALRHTDLEIYLRYQTTHDRAYARASAELMKRRKERQLDERGFVSKKRAEAAEERRDASEKRQIEKHSVHIATAKARLERQTATAPRTGTEPRAQASGDFQPLPPKKSKMAA